MTAGFEPPSLGSSRRTVPFRRWQPLAGISKVVDSEGVEPSAGSSVRRTAAPRPSPHKETRKANVPWVLWMLAFCFHIIEQHNMRVMQKQVENDNAHVILSTKWQVYFFLTHRGENVIREWLSRERIQNTQIANFQAKIDAFEQGGPDLSPGLIVGPVAKKIYKMKIKGNKGHVQLRPMLCYGPFGTTEVTLLLGVIEKDFKLRPDDWKRLAQDNREILIANPLRRIRERLT